MLMRKLGRTGLKVSALCLGGNTFGWTTDQKASEAVLDAYVEAGGNFIDTADVYSRWAPGNKGGESETALGTWLTGRKNRASVLIATKVCGPMGPGPNDAGLSRAHIMEGVEASLRRLQTDYIDLYQAHWDDKETPLEETLRAFDDLVRQGKVRYIGASNYPGVAAHPRALGERAARLRALRVPAAQVQPGDPRRVRARARAPLPRADDRRDPVLLAGQRVPLGQVPLGRADAQDRARRRRREDLHERARLPRAGRGREGGGGRQRHARAGVALVAGAPAGHHRADRERHVGGAAQGAGRAGSSSCWTPRAPPPWIRRARGARPSV